MLPVSDLAMILGLGAMLFVGQRLAGSRRFSKRLLSSVFSAAGLFGLIVSISVVVLRLLHAT